MLAESELRWRAAQAEAKATALATLDDLHSFGERSDANPSGDCLTCIGAHGGPGPCDHRYSSSQDRRFVLAHLEEYVSAYENPGSAYASRVMERLAEERHNLSRGHICNEPGGCPVENSSRGIPACPACRARWQAQANRMCARCQKLPRQFRPRSCGDCATLGGMEIGLEIGRTSPVTAPAPMTTMLDYFSWNT